MIAGSSKPLIDTCYDSGNGTPFCPRIMPTQDNDTNSCLNCQANLEGPFCAQCGQSRSLRLVPITDWLGDFFGTFLKLDSKLFRTMKRILLQPGMATLDFAYGHRVSYSGPARVYIIMSAISIAAMSLQGVFSEHVVIPGLNVDANFQKRVQFLFPFINLLSPFVTAAILAAFQRKLFFQLHLAFSLHFWSFMVTIATPMIFIPPTSIWSLISFIGLSIISTAYLILAHRRVYAMAMLNRLFICAIILLSVPIASIVFTAILFALAAML